VPEKFVVKYAVIITAFLSQAFLFCLVGQGIIAEVSANFNGNYFRHSMKSNFLNSYFKNLEYRGRI
jgi:hypothetical protein